MMNFVEILKVYDETGVYNHTMECLRSENEYERNYAIEKVRKMNFQNEGEVKLWVTYNI